MILAPPPPPSMVTALPLLSTVEREEEGPQHHPKPLVKAISQRAESAVQRLLTPEMVQSIAAPGIKKERKKDGFA